MLHTHLKHSLLEKRRNYFMLPNFEENLQKYAKLLVAKGINVQPGDWVKVTISVEQAQLARLITKEAYALGAEKVIIKWSEDEITRYHFLHQPLEVLTEIPAYEIEEVEDHILNRKVSRLSIVSSDPGLLDDIDSKKVAEYQKVAAKAFEV